MVLLMSVCCESNCDKTVNRAEMTDKLSDFQARCRCCLEDTKGDTYVKITKVIEERFLEFTLTPVRI